VSAPRDVAAGRDFTCAVEGGGRVLCWGDNAFGQCGQSLRTPARTPQAVPGVTNATRVAVGGSHACALLADGAVHCWGLNTNAQLGRPFVRGMDAPGVVAGLTASALFLGESHSCAISGAEVRCWGNTAGLRLGAPMMVASQPTPTTVPGVMPMAGGPGVAGDAFACVLNSRRTVQCWGAGAFGQLGQPGGTIGAAAPTEGAVFSLSDVDELAAGSRHVCARAAGTVSCWGANTLGQLGRGSSAQPRAAAAAVDFGAAVTSATEVAVGGAHACTIRDGDVWCWGAGNKGQLADPRMGHRTLPVRVMPPSSSASTALCAGQEHTCAIYGTEVWCWGANANGQLGGGAVTPSSATPVRVDGLPARPLSLACGGDFTCARLMDASVHCWGSNRTQVLGEMLPGGMMDRPSPGPVVGLSATAIAAGLSSMCAARGDGSVVCWGAGFAGQLGNGMEAIVARAAPMPVAGVMGAIGATGGALHHCAWGSAGLSCWGTNTERQLGQANPRTPLVAGPVVSLMGVTGASAGYLHTCAIHGAGLSCWGDNTQRACGVATGSVVATPSSVSLPATPTALAAGGGATPGIELPSTSTCAIVAGAPLCWGSNEVGELGDGAAFSVTPMEVMLPAP
jgi:alpha-tubulin suppressor-like RCC1 family protein